MDFIINHSGFFLGIGVTLLLALIGYYSEKKDSSKNKNNDNSSKSTTLGELPSDNVNMDNASNNEINDGSPRGGKFINFVNTDQDSVFNLDNSLKPVQNEIPEMNVTSNGDQSNVPDINGFANTVQNGISEVSVTSNDVQNNVPDINVGINNDVPIENNNVVENNNVSDLSNNITEANNYVQSNNGLNQVDEVNNVNPSSDNISNQNQNFVEQSSPISFGANDFENINMSLEDLEKKNYDKIINNNVLDDSDNYYYSELDTSNVDNSNSVVSPDLNNAISNESANVIDANIGINNDISTENSNVPIENNSIENNNLNNNIVENNNVDSSNYENVNNDAVVDNSGSIDNYTEDVGHEFDNEVQSDDGADGLQNVSDTFDSVPEIFSGDNNEAVQNNTTIEEQITTDSSVIDPLNNSSDDDIWKF